MCTAISYRSGGLYFGRTLDYYISYGEQVVLTPRNFAFDFCASPHYAIQGMAAVREGYPLYFDAFNEKGLCMAALNFKNSACYFAPRADKACIASFELIPWVLSTCDSVACATAALENAVITDRGFSGDLPPSRLHWMIADSTQSAVIEQTKDGLFVYDCAPDVLTNEPPYPEQIKSLERLAMLSPESPEGESHGLGAVGLPGDLSSSSRFMRAAFTVKHALKYDTEEEAVCQFFHILGSVFQVQGCCRVGDRHEYTQYTCCMSARRGIYYYTTYTGSRITAVDMHRENLNSTNLSCTRPEYTPKIYIQN